MTLQQFVARWRNTPTNLYKRLGSFSHEFTKAFYETIINQYKAGLPLDYEKIVKQQASM